MKCELEPHAPHAAQPVDDVGSEVAGHVQLVARRREAAQRRVEEVRACLRVDELDAVEVHPPAGRLLLRHPQDDGHALDGRRLGLIRFRGQC